MCPGGFMNYLRLLVMISCVLNVTEETKTIAPYGVDVDQY